MNFLEKLKNIINFEFPKKVGNVRFYPLKIKARNTSITITKF